MTISRFDPINLGQYEEAPELLHFQWIGKKCKNKVYRYALVDIIEPNDIDAELKQTKTDRLKSCYSPPKKRIRYCIQ